MAEKRSSENTIDNAYTNVGIEFVLENGNIITKADYSNLGVLWRDTDLKELCKSDEIYPIKKVNAIISY